MAKQMFLTGETTMYSLVVCERPNGWEYIERHVFSTDDLEVAEAYKKRFNSLVSEQHRRMVELDESDDENIRDKCYDMCLAHYIDWTNGYPLGSFECTIVKIKKRDIVLNK